MLIRAASTNMVKRLGEQGLVTATLPASANHELSLYLGWVKRVIFSHREGLMRNTIHVECHTWELHIEDEVMPILITDLPGKKEA
jgi:hypothetical protein